MRHRHAGILKHPKKMTSEVLEWAQQNIAHYLLKEAKKRYPRVAEMSKDYDLVSKVKVERSTVKVEALLRRITNPLVQPPKSLDQSEIDQWASFNLMLLQRAHEETLKAQKEIKHLEALSSRTFESEKWFKINLDDWYFKTESLKDYAEKEKASWELKYQQTKNPDYLDVIHDYDKFLRGKKSQFGHIRVILSPRAPTASWAPSMRTLTLPMKLEDLERMISHELTHVGQSIGQEIIGIKDFGLPSSSYRDKDIKQRKTDLSLSRERFKENTEAHHLDDIEFFTDLKDEIIKIEKHLESHDGDREQLFKDYLSKSTFFSTLMRRNRGKWKRAVSEAYNSIFNRRASIRRVANKAKAKIPSKYTKGLAKSVKERREGQIRNRLKGKGKNIYEPLKGDHVDTKPSKYSKTDFAEKVRAEMKGNSKDDFLDAASKVSGYPKNILKKVHERGAKAWATSGHRPGATQIAWARARVYSFCTGGKTTTTGDKDLYDSIS